MFIEKCKAVMVGHAVADALGVPVEFESRKSLDVNPVTDMMGYGTYPVPEGAWSDDTSMALCTLEALGTVGLDYDKIMDNFGRWYYNDEFTPTDKLFDIGYTCSRAIDNYCKLHKPYSECGLCDDYSNGNGSLMRIHPVVLYAYRLDCTLDKKIEIVETASALTHAHKRSKMGCGIYAFVLWELLKNPVQEGIYAGLTKAKAYYEGEGELKSYERLLAPDFKDTRRELIKSSGYVVDSLEAAIWCLLNFDSYRDCVLNAVNLGSDTDTVGAVTGGLAGALYGYEAIPESWRNTLIRREYIEGLCDRAFKD
ncbi:MAG: ADP-ribosylglycohydrolase family protein [Candidatus Coproplasma sp.]